MAIYSNGYMGKLSWDAVAAESIEALAQATYSLVPASQKPNRLWLKRGHGGRAPLLAIWPDHPDGFPGLQPA